LREFTGSGTYYENISRRLVKEGNRVWLISNVLRDADDFRRDGVQFVHVPRRRSAIPFTSLFGWERRVSDVLRRIEAEHGLDLVEFQSFHPEGLLYALSLRRPAVSIRVHEWKNRVGLRWLCRDPREAILQALCWLQMARADVLLPVSDAVHDACAQFMGSGRYSRKTFTIRPGMDMELYAPTHVRPGCYQPLEGKRIILFVGRITRAKGAYKLIDAFKDQIAPRFADTVLVLIGKPEDPDRLRCALEGLPDRVIHLVDVETKDMPRCYTHAYVFVGPSESEPFGAVFVEALACGLPVIGVAVGGPVEIVEPEKTGLLCADNSSASIARALERLLSDRELRERMAGAARASVAERYGIDRVVSELIPRYRATMRLRIGAS
jgi:glycosyltransferase involved in cell wall biosynthesis